MSSQHPLPPDPLAYTRQPRSQDDAPSPSPRPLSGPAPHTPPKAAPLTLRIVAGIAASLLLLLLAALVGGRLWLQHAMRDALPQTDGVIFVSGLRQPVSVTRDPHGVPTIRASSLDDLVFAQAYITAGDRLFQMDALRRHAAGDLAEVLGPGLLEHDRSQRILRIRATADAAVSRLPPSQLHTLEVYARGVNASIEAQARHLPVEFRILRYQPRPWVPRDSVLIGLVMFEDLTNRFPEKLNREALTARLAPDLPPEQREQLLLDLYPVGSWRDHPPSQPVPDLTTPGDEIPNIPLDESQTQLRRPAPPSTATVADLLALRQTLTPAPCPGCQPGSNNWVVSGARTASRLPLLSNDMHLNLSIPGIWYTANLETVPTFVTGSTVGLPEPFHVSGVTLPGTPFVIVGHNRHVAWGITNLGADVQDLYIEHLRGTGVDGQFAAADGSWQPVLHAREVIHVRGAPDVSLDVTATRHGASDTPIISPLVHSEHRTLALRWIIYDPGILVSPFFEINAAPDAAALVAAFGSFAGPAQNLVYADDRGHIGYHAVGRIPLRGSADLPSRLSSVPTDATAFDAPTHEWSTDIPYDRLPQTVDPPGGILATANNRTTPDAYPFPIADNWGDPYRNERLWKLLAGREHLLPSDMLAIQGDIYSDPDRVIAQRLAYAIDHATATATATATKGDARRLHAAADLLRTWNGKVSSDSPAAAIVDAARSALWPLLLNPRFAAPSLAEKPSGLAPEPWRLYDWGEAAFAEEQLIMHTPARWLPPAYPTWDDLLVAAVGAGLKNAHAPSNLAKWRFGDAHPLDMENPVFGQSAILRRLAGMPTGIHSTAQSGDGTTVKQVGRGFGPSERFTADLADPDASTLNLVLGQSEDPSSPWFRDQFPAWLHVTTLNLPFNHPSTPHTLTLTPR